MKLDFNDILITPAVLSNINSRSEVNPYNTDNMLPLMTAPMDTVVDIHNAEYYNENKVYAILPRTTTAQMFSQNKKIWHSYSLSQFENIFIKSSVRLKEPTYTLIDVANGHMMQVFDLVKEAKQKHGDLLILMAGNIANSKTYFQYANLGLDYIRLGIGNGNGCLTTQQTGVGYPMASLIKECYEYKKVNSFKTKIVADGGCKNYSDIIKALALGCFLPHAIVNTSEGKKRIKDVNVGDYVYTHRNRLKKVMNTWTYENNKTIVEINGIPSTSNHHYYVVNKKYKHLVTDENVHNYAEWIAAENLNANYLLIDNS